jgi:hypothetical protein
MLNPLLLTGLTDEENSVFWKRSADAHMLASGKMDFRTGVLEIIKGADNSEALVVVTGEKKDRRCHNCPILRTIKGE